MARAWPAASVPAVGGTVMPRKTVADDQHDHENQDQIHNGLPIRADCFKAGFGFALFMSVTVEPRAAR